MLKNFVRENVPLSRFGVLVAQLESIGASASQQSPDPLLSFDLLSDLISAIDEEPLESILLWQRKCEDALYSLLKLGARRPVRHLASVAMAKIISKGDTISIYSRASSLQGFLSDAKRNEPQRVAGCVMDKIFGVETPCDNALIGEMRCSLFGFIAVIDLSFYFIGSSCG
ncbi:unnamed protein product [Dovyalis caffra]|uniref:Uncharacterized protein n=1 Tax=Dovyalis caffra TaxID=77055 RepID=A0AAV1S2Q2_9ROSI|nr:unnamed protein product [Dovyalis caffra]